MCKKIIILIIIIFSFGNVKAIEAGKMGILTNRCVVKNGNSVIIPVKVVGFNDGLLSNRILEYELGLIDNNKDLYSVEMQNIKGEKIKDIVIDNRRNSSQESKVILSLSDNIELTNMKEFLSFDLVYSLKKDVDKIDVLGNNIYITEDSNFCSKLNNGNIINNGKMEKVNIEKNNTKGIWSLVFLAISFILNVILIVYIKVNN